jgi:hypothetical protein
MLKSILNPSASVTAGVATIAAVFGIYQLNVGNVSVAQATDANHPALDISRRKAGYTSLVLVAALVLVTKDANIGILGGGTIIAMELNTRHAIMAHPETGRLINPNAIPAYEPAENVIPFAYQGETA